MAIQIPLCDADLHPFSDWTVVLRDCVGFQFPQEETHRNLIHHIPNQGGIHLDFCDQSFPVTSVGNFLEILSDQEHNLSQNGSWDLENGGLENEN